MTVYTLLGVIILETIALIYLTRLTETTAKTLLLTQQVAQEYKSAASAWKQFAEKVRCLATATEGIKAILDGEDIVLEHPDPVMQAEANRLMTDLKRLAQQLQTARVTRSKPNPGLN